MRKPTASPSKKWEVVTAYLALGNMTAVAAATGVSANTIRTWKTQDWWRELEGIIKEEEGTEQSVKLRQIVDKTLNIVADRLENGDFQYDPKTGGLIRRPVLLRDAGKVGMDVWTRKEAVDQLKFQKLKQPSIEESLKRIAEEFAKIARGANGKELQEGVRELPRSTGAEEGSSGEKCSPFEDGSEAGSLDFLGCGSQEGVVEGGLEQPEQPATSGQVEEPLVPPEQSGGA